MRTVENYAQWFVNECARVAREGHSKMMLPGGTFEGLYLWYRPGELLIAADGPPGFTLGEHQRVPGDLTVEQLTVWVNGRASRLPCLPSEQR